MANCCAGAVVVPAAIVGVVFASLGLAGACSLTTVSVASLATSFLNPISVIPQLIVSILGLTGHVSVVVVSGVTLAFSLLTLVAATVGCCITSRAYAFYR